jgi:sulfate adenylyltransferase subunit 2
MITDKESAEIYYNLPQFQRLLQQTKDFIVASLEKVKNPYLSCSFGKDSSVMLHLVRQFYPDIPVLFYRVEETDYIDNYREVIAWWNLKNFFVFSYISKLRANGDMGIVLPSLAEWKNAVKKYDSYFIGLREEESKKRRITLRYHGMFYQAKNGMIRICPIAKWKLNDVIAYTLVHGIPLLNTYIVQGYDQRTHATIPSMMAQESMQSLKYRDKNAYNLLVKFIPGAKYYV